MNFNLIGTPGIVKFSLLLSPIIFHIFFFQVPDLIAESGATLRSYRLWGCQGKSISKGTVGEEGVAITAKKIGVILHHSLAHTS